MHSGAHRRAMRLKDESVHFKFESPAAPSTGISPSRDRPKGHSPSHESLAPSRLPARRPAPRSLRITTPTDSWSLDPSRPPKRSARQKCRLMDVYIYIASVRCCCHILKCHAYVVHYHNNNNDIFKCRATCEVVAPSPPVRKYLRRRGPPPKTSQLTMCSL